jgi:lipopolysaccharide biosynthesis glycosyltransferase
MNNLILESTQLRLRHAYLGQVGIHAIGLNRSQQTIRIYIDPNSKLTPEWIEQLHQMATPFGVEIIPDTSARIA